jgi:DNA-directed RNA polymerase specialized sigma24 family protein
MPVKDDLQDYIKQASAILHTYGDYWMLRSDECIGDVARWIMHADNTYDPSKGAKPGTWRVVTAMYRIKHIRWAQWKRQQQEVCFTDVSDAEREHLDDLIYNRTESPPTVADVAAEMLDVIISRSKLSKRQHQVVGMRRDGLTLREIGAKLGSSKQACHCSLAVAVEKCQIYVKGLDPMTLL